MKWISVKDQLPPLDVCILGIVREKNKEHRMPFISMVFHSNGKWFERDADDNCELELFWYIDLRSLMTKEIEDFHLSHMDELSRVSRGEIWFGDMSV